MERCINGDIVGHEEHMFLTLMTLGVSTVAVPDEWLGDETVLEIYTGYSSGHFLFKTSGYIVNPSLCSDPSLYSVEPDNADVESILSVLLAVKMSGANVKIAVDGDRCGTGGVAHLSGKISVSRVALF